MGFLSQGYANRISELFYSLDFFLTEWKQLSNNSVYTKDHISGPTAHNTSVLGIAYAVHAFKNPQANWSHGLYDTNSSSCFTTFYWFKCTLSSAAVCFGLAAYFRTDLAPCHLLRKKTCIFSSSCKSLIR